MAPRMPAFVVAPCSGMALSLAYTFRAASVHFGLGVFDGAPEPALLRELERERERELRRLDAADGFVGAGERARVRAAAAFGDAFFAAAFLGNGAAVFFGAALFGLLRFAAGAGAATGCGSGDLARAGDLAVDFRAEGDRDAEDVFVDVRGEAGWGSSALMGVVVLAPTDCSSDARRLGEICGDFFALAAPLDDDVDVRRHAATTAAVTSSSL